jgi:hypothetical protein
MCPRPLCAYTRVCDEFNFNNAAVTHLTGHEQRRGPIMRRCLIDVRTRLAQRFHAAQMTICTCPPNRRFTRISHTCHLIAVSTNTNQRIDRLDVPLLAAECIAHRLLASTAVPSAPAATNSATSCLPRLAQLNCSRTPLFMSSLMGIPVILLPWFMSARHLQPRLQC